jgi:hypothetical protein
MSMLLVITYRRGFGVWLGTDPENSFEILDLYLKLIFFATR